jgi:hypothetical protein
LFAALASGSPEGREYQRERSVRWITENKRSKSGLDKINHQAQKEAQHQSPKRRAHLHEGTILPWSLSFLVSRLLASDKDIIVPVFEHCKQISQKNPFCVSLYMHIGPASQDCSKNRFSHRIAQMSRDETLRQRINNNEFCLPSLTISR